MRRTHHEPPKAADAAEIARFCAKVLDQHKAEKIEIVEVFGSLQIADYFVVASAANPRHLKAAGEALLKELRQAGIGRVGVEGYGDARWILIDLLDVVVHLFVEESRQYYDLSNLWGDCPRLSWRNVDRRSPAEAGAGARAELSGLDGG